MPSRESAPARFSWDKVGISLSSLCLVHCFITAGAIVLVPMLGLSVTEGWSGIAGNAAGITNHYFHWLMAGFLLPVAGIAFVRGFRHHQDLRVLGLGILGALALLLALVIPHELLEQMGHARLTIAGSLLLIAGHYFNRRGCHRCTHH